MRTAIIAIALSTLAAAAAEARTSFPSAPMRQAGMLTCDIEPGVGLVLGSTRGASCRFVSNRGGFVQPYGGRMDRAGLDLGVASPQSITWRVTTPGGASRTNMLNGMFVGPSAEATLFGGSGTQVSFGYGADRVVLEPVRQSGQAGFNFAVGEGRFDIGSTAPAIIR
jgi:hypothetical protein